jgi:hypothetical protein
MNPGFSEFLKATQQDRRDVFLGAAARLGTPAVRELEAMGRKKRQACLDAIKAACRDYIQNTDAASPRSCRKTVMSMSSENLEIRP